MNYKFTYASLFSGIGGFETALNRLGGECVFASEINKFASQAYELIYGIKPYGDITKIDAEQVPDHDLLTAGFPCQSFSVAGKRLGFEDTRGTLFFEIARIAQEKKPKALLLENVKGLINHAKSETFNTMIQVLCDIGYTIDFTILNSKYFDVPQNRERVFVVAIRDDLIESKAWTNVEGQTVVPRGKQRIQELEGVKTFNFDWPPQEQVTKRLRDILESNVDERFYLSEEKMANLVEQLSAKEGLQQTGYIEKNMQGNRVYDTDGVGATVASQTGGLGGRGVTLVKDTPEMLGLLDMKGNESIRRVDSAAGVSPTLTTMEGGHREPKVAVTVYGIGLSKQATEITRKTEISNTIMALDYKGFGNQEMTGVIEEIPDWIPKPNDINNTLRTGGRGSLTAKHNYDHVAEEVRPVLTPDRMEKRQNGRRFKEDEEEMFTLTAQDRHGIAVRNIETPKYRIRKLTPLECFRLQAFPDEYHEILSANGISNSQLYKMAGNAVTVNKVIAVGERLLPYLERRNKR